MLTETTRYVRFIGGTEAQATWNGGSDPRGVLRQGAVYEVLMIEVSGWYTPVRLVQCPTASFNSVMFEAASPICPGAHGRGFSR